MNTLSQQRALAASLSVIGGRGSFATPGSILKVCSSEYHGPFTSAAGVGPYLTQS